MKNQDAIEKLRKYNEDERFYQSYFIARQNPDMLKIFLNSYSKEELLERKLIVPDLAGTWYPEDMQEFCFDEEYLKQSIALIKHNRFTPVFEHSHSFYELSYVIEGTCQEVIDNVEITLKKGELCLIPPGVRHSIGVFDDSIVINLLIWKSDFTKVCHNLLHDHNSASDFLNRTLDRDQPQGFIFFSSQEDPSVERLILEMISVYKKGSRDQDLLLSAQLLYLFSRLIHDHGQTIQIYEPEETLSEQSKKILSIIDRNFTTLSLQDLADQLNFSTGYLSRLIKKEFSSTFTQLIQDRKFKLAENLLKTSMDPIFSISEQAGFESVEHFNRLFKKHFEMTPGQYRKKYGNDC